MNRYVKNERDKMVVEAYPGQIYTKKQGMNLLSIFPLVESPSVKCYISTELRSEKCEPAKNHSVYLGSSSRAAYIRDHTRLPYDN